MLGKFVLSKFCPYESDLRHSGCSSVIKMLKYGTQKANFSPKSKNWSEYCVRKPSVSIYNGIDC